MIATAVSRVNKRSWATINKETINVDRELPVFPKSVRSKCPAIILAESRTARVPGRMIFLIVSIKTINGINTGGVPWGTRWANICFVLLIHPKNMKLNHKGRARDSVNVMWLVLVKIYGNKPRKLLKRINVNNEINIKVVPL